MKVEVIDNNGAPSGEKHIIFYNPPVVKQGVGIRHAALWKQENSKMLIKNSTQTIIF